MSTPAVFRRTRLARTAALLLILPAAAGAQLKREAPTSLTDAEFWSFFTTMSEPSGYFLSENFVSNEMSFQSVIPVMQRSLTPGGVYMGVGPEQNFTYIANLKPRLAVIIDIRRQNAMQHLMYKALFEQSATRAEFVSRLFSRPTVARLAPSIAVAALFDSVDAAAPNDSAFHANRDAIIKTLAETHGFGLSPEDVVSINHVYAIFFEAGPDINYGYRPNANYMRPNYATYAMLQGATNADSLPMAFLSTEGSYQTVRDMEMRNMVVPVVGDFAGPKAIRAVGEYLRQRNLTVTAFYCSNVEQYLFQNGVSNQFYSNVATLPIDTTSTFIRSVPAYGSGGFGFNRPGLGNVMVAGGSTTFSINILDSAGVRIIRATQDSAGVRVTRTLRDSSGQVVGIPGGIVSVRPARPDTTGGRIGTMRAGPVMPVIGMMGGGLTSGLMSIRATLNAFDGGRVTSYQDIIAMTKTSGWK